MRKFASAAEYRRALDRREKSDTSRVRTALDDERQRLSDLATEPIEPRPVRHRWEDNPPTLIELLEQEAKG